MKSLAFPEDELTSELGILENYFQVDRKGVIEKICQNHIIVESHPICDHISSHWTLDFWILMEVTFSWLCEEPHYSLFNYLPKYHLPEQGTGAQSDNCSLGACMGSMLAS